MKFQTIILAVLANIGVFAAASAAPVTIQFSGAINAFGSDFVSTPLQIGDQIMGSFTFDDSAASTGSATRGTLYPFTAAEISLSTIGNFASDTVGDITIGNGVFGGQDLFQLNANLLGTNGGRLRLTAQDSTGAAFSSDGLAELVALAQSGDLSGFDSLSLVIIVLGNGAWGECNGDCGIFASFDNFSISTSVIPLPAALPLFIAGLAGFGVIGRRRKARIA